VSERQFRLSDGRRAGITTLGDAAATRWVLFCHPAPGASGFDPAPTVTQRCPLEFVSLDRPGYGSSDPWPVPPQPSPQRWVLDVQEFLASCRDDAWSIRRTAYRDLAVLGWREGCIFAAALAAALGGEVSSVVFVEPMTLSHAARSLREREVWSTERLVPEDFEGDGRADGLRSRVERMLRAAGDQGDAGLEADRGAVKQHVLDESLESIRAQALIVTANTKPMLRSAHRYAGRLPRARVAVTEAPVPIVAHWRRILDQLQAAAPDGTRPAQCPAPPGGVISARSGRGSTRTPSRRG
jgi:pimeloyl-ACP methyl ester carboxylesterase